MKNFLIVVVFVLLLSSCAFSVPTGKWYSDIKGGVAVTSNSVSKKVGTSECISVLGLVATGDASIQEAAKEAGISKISHVDYQYFSVLGLFARYTTIVYGE